MRKIVLFTRGFYMHPINGIHLYASHNACDLCCTPLSDSCVARQMGLIFRMRSNVTLLALYVHAHVPKCGGSHTSPFPPPTIADTPCIPSTNTVLMSAKKDTERAELVAFTPLQACSARDRRRVASGVVGCVDWHCARQFFLGGEGNKMWRALCIQGCLTIRHTCAMAGRSGVLQDTPSTGEAYEDVAPSGPSDWRAMAMLARRKIRVGATGICASWVAGSCVGHRLNICVHSSNDIAWLSTTPLHGHFDATMLASPMAPLPALAHLIVEAR